MNVESTVYPFSPLIETAFEIKFPGDPNIPCLVNNFYNKIKHNYTDVLVPLKRLDNKIDLLPLYNFENADKSYTVIIGLDRLSVSCKKYQGFKVFKENVKQVFTSFSDVFKVKSLLRVGLRYINIIPFTREEGLIPFKNYLNIDLKLPGLNSSVCDGLSLVLVSKIELGGNITVRVGIVKGQDETQEGILLDYDYSKVSDITYDKVEIHLEESHTYTKKLFESMISNEYRKVMKGEVI